MVEKKTHVGTGLLSAETISMLKIFLATKPEGHAYIRGFVDFAVKDSMERMKERMKAKEDSSLPPVV